MRFTKPLWAGIAEGTVTVAFRRWNRPTVVSGRIYRTGGGRVRIESVEEITPEQITMDDAVKAGNSNVAEVEANLNPDQDRRLYRVRFTVVDEPDPRERLAETDQLTEADIEEIDGRLDRYDAASSFGPWTRQTLALVAENPARRAPDLAAMAGRETTPFKLDVRKLKNLGLTRSLRVGYELSPRGVAYNSTRD